MNLHSAICSPALKETFFSFSMAEVRFASSSNWLSVINEESFCVILTYSENRAKGTGSKLRKQLYAFQTNKKTEILQSPSNAWILHSAIEAITSG